MVPGLVGDFVIETVIGLLPLLDWSLSQNGYGEFTCVERNIILNQWMERQRKVTRIPLALHTNLPLPFRLNW